MYDFFNILAGIFLIGTIASIVYVIIKAVKKQFAKQLFAIPVILFLIYLVICAVTPDKPADNSEPKQTDAATEAITTEAATTEAETTELETDSSVVKSGTYELSNGMTLFFSDSVRNDVTGNWRITTMADSSAIGDYAVEYYETLFSSDEEIHAIVNFTLKTTTKITKIDDLLDVTVYEYVSKEEHDAKLLFSGTKLTENTVKISAEENTGSDTPADSGEISSDAFIAAVKEAIQGQIGEGEAYEDVSLKDGDLCVSVDFTNVDPSPLTLEDLALSRTSSITDAILELDQYDSLWDTITVDFGDVGQVKNGKDNIVDSTYGRYFAVENFTLK